MNTLFLFDSDDDQLDTYVGNLDNYNAMDMNDCS